MNFHDGERLETSEGDFSKLFVADSDSCSRQIELHQKSRFLRSIAFAEVGYPFDAKWRSVEIIDTPGSYLLAETGVPQEFWRQADAIVTVRDARQAPTALEIDLLTELLNEGLAENLFFAVNKVDELRNLKERERVYDFFVKRYAETIGKPPQMFLVSAKEALAFKRLQSSEKNDAGKPIKCKVKSLDETGFPQFEEALTQHLLQKCGEWRPPKIDGAVAWDYFPVDSVAKAEKDPAVIINAGITSYKAKKYGKALDFVTYAKTIAIDSATVSVCRKYEILIYQAMGKEFLAKKLADEYGMPLDALQV